MLDVDFEVERRDLTVRIALKVSPGERIAVVGPSGAGKTTFLEALAGLVRLSAGEIKLDHRLLSSAAGGGFGLAAGHRGIGLLRQNPGLFPHLTVLQNICYPSGADADQATRSAARIGLGGMLQARPRGLSGGEAQRVALCRVLQTKVKVLCLDEPFNALDRSLGAELRDLLQAELEASATSAILVTHRLEEAQAFADRIAVLSRGSLLQVATPRELVLRPQTAMVASLVGYRGWLRRGDQLAAIHPDRIALVAGEESGAISGRVVAMTPDGARIDVALEAEGEWAGRFHWLTEAPPQIGSRVFFQAEGTPVFSGQAAALG